MASESHVIERQFQAPIRVNFPDILRWLKTGLVGNARLDFWVNPSTRMVKPGGPLSQHDIVIELANRGLYEKITPEVFDLLRPDELARLRLRAHRVSSNIWTQDQQGLPDGPIVAAMKDRANNILATGKEEFSRVLGIATEDSTLDTPPLNNDDDKFTEVEKRRNRVLALRNMKEGIAGSGVSQPTSSDLERNARKGLDYAIERAQREFLKAAADLEPK